MRTLIQLILVLFALALMAVKSTESRQGGVEIGNGRSGKDESAPKASDGFDRLNILGIQFSEKSVEAGGQVKIRAVVEITREAVVRSCEALLNARSNEKLEASVPLDECRFERLTERIYSVQLKHRFHKRLSDVRFRLSELNLGGFISWPDNVVSPVIEVRARKPLPELKVLNAWVKTREAGKIRKGELAELKIQFQSKTKISAGSIQYLSEFTWGPEEQKIELAEIQGMIEQDQYGNILTLTLPIFVSKENPVLKSVSIRRVELYNASLQPLQTDLPGSIELQIVD